jgi:HEAT repeat protein
LDYVVALHKRGDSDTFRAAADLLGSPDPNRRVLAVDVLAQLGADRDVPVERRPFASPAADVRLDLLPGENEPEVLASITTACGHLRDPRCVPLLHGLRDHQDERVRFGVVFGLLGIDDDLAVQTLIELTVDGDAHVRDWATFGLGTQIDRDDPKLRSALVARLDDPDDETRSEAIRGLAVRGDARAIPQLLTDLQCDTVPEDPSVLEEALLKLASRTADPRLCQRVSLIEREWRKDRPDEELPADLQSAIESCNHARPTTG